MKYVEAKKLQHFAQTILESKGVPKVDAVRASVVLIETSLRGIDTHGIRLLPIYARMLDSGKVNAKPSINIRPLKATITHIDADYALGQVAAMKAVDESIKLAKHSGLGAVAVASANHFGAAGYYALKMAEENCIGLVFSNTDAQVVPFNGKRKFFGTNPLAIAAKGENGEFFCLDMTTSQISFSAISMHKDHGMALKSGWAVDENGHETLKSTEAQALLPLGGHKGQGLAMAVEILCTLLAGSLFDHELNSLFDPNPVIARGVGHLFIAIDIQPFSEIKVFQKRLSSLLMLLAEEEPAHADSPIFYPGQRESETKVERLEAGIPITAALWSELLALNEFLEEKILT